MLGLYTFERGLDRQREPRRQALDVELDLVEVFLAEL